MVRLFRIAIVLLDKARLLQFIEAGILDAITFQAIAARHGLAGPWEKFRQQFLTES